MPTEGKTALELLDEFFYSDSRRGLNLWEWMFVLFIKLLIVLSIFLVVLLLVTGIPVFVIWAAKPAIIFLFDHWQWTLGGFCLLIALVVLSGRRARNRRTNEEKARAAHN